MNILLLSIGYPPVSIGGTEIYVQALAQELIDQGHQVSVVIPSDKNSTRVVGKVVVDEISLPRFTVFLANTKVEVVHAHPLITNPFNSFLDECKQSGIPIVVTYHTPTLSCGRGDLILNGDAVCDGVIRQRRCTVCIMQEKGLPVLIGKMVAALPGLGSLETIMPVRKISSLFSIPRLVQQHYESWQRLVGLTDQWIAVSKWVRRVLELNGVSSDQITVIRQALCHKQQREEIDSVASNGLKVGFVGRIHPHKGLHILLEALRYLPQFKIEVHIAGNTQDLSEAYRKKLDSVSRGEQRIKWWGQQRPDEIYSFLSKMDVLVVPSLWMESGPMTVLEAWAAGIPIIGSDLGGIREWVNDYGGGLLFPPGDTRSLAKILGQFVEGKSSIDLPSCNRLPTMNLVAKHMVVVYKKIVA